MKTDKALSIRFVPILLIAIIVLAIFLIMGDEIRNFVNDLLQAWFGS